MNGRPIVGRDAARQTRRDEAMIGWSPFHLAVIVGAGAPRQQPEAIRQRRQRPERVRHATLEPAIHAGAHPAKNDTTLPGQPQSSVHPVQPPDGQQIGDVTAADIDDVLGQE